MTVQDDVVERSWGDVVERKAIDLVGGRLSWMQGLRRNICTMITEQRPFVCQYALLVLLSTIG